MINKTNITKRIEGLRSQMFKNQIDAYILTGADPHLSEDTPINWKTREWISGFTGSYGKVLVTLERALLWTDTRYFIQAIDELQGTEIELMKDRIPDAISVEEWILQNMKPGSIVAVDGLTISAFEASQISSKIAAKGISLNVELDLVSTVWSDRPIILNKPVYEHPLCFAGKSRVEKIELVRNVLSSKGLDSMVVSMLEDIAWLFNLRSDEIQYTPIFTAYAYISIENSWLFIHPDKVTDLIRSSLEIDKIKIGNYDTFFSFLKRIKNARIQIDPLRSNSFLKKCLIASNTIEQSVSVITQTKAVKSEKEIEKIREAHIKDGVAMVYSLFWIVHNIKNEIITEISIRNKLNEFRSKQLFYKGESFHPIVGHGAHGAIVHYHSTSQSDIAIEMDNLVLIDSGGQYLDGTTDITRTISLGNVTERQKEDFTTCLKGHIALAMAIFPEGTKGYSLDAITRKPLWDRGINYGHGTGHGIGYFSSVHEGPMSIRSESNNEPIIAGHLLSNEPGIYREDEYGIRIENVMLCIKYQSNEFGGFLCFETVSLCPIDQKLIITGQLSKEEINWIDHYHETVLNKISPYITDTDVLHWLKRQCEPLKLS